MAMCDAAAFLRIGAIAIALYDWIWTIPPTIQLYRAQPSFTNMSRACLLFILIRYTSILTIVISNIGFFASAFTPEACHKFYLISPSLKAAQTMISQLIIAVRTMAVARQASWVIWTVSMMFVASVALEFFGNIWHRVPFQEPDDAHYANCTSGNEEGLKVAWVHYMAAMVYDAICMLIACGYIYVQSRNSSGHSLDALSRMLLKQGLMYFGFLTAVNVLNLVLYTSIPSEEQSGGATLGYTTTWIMSQRLILHLQEYKNNNRTYSYTTTTKGVLPPFLTITTHSSAHLDPYSDIEFGGVHVTVEEAVEVDYYGEDIVDQHRRHHDRTRRSKHHITTARIEREYRRCEDRRWTQDRTKTEADGGDEIDEAAAQADFDARARRKAGGEGWEVTSAGRLFSP